MSSDIKKIKARDEMISSSEKELGGFFGNLNAKQQSIAATKFFIREINNPIGIQISEDDLFEALVDGSNDLGCDLIYRDDGHVIIVQSKYRNSSALEDTSEISHFQQILQRFRNPALKPNTVLREVLADIDWKTDSFSLVFITFSKLTEQARAISSQPAGYPDDVPDLDQRCEWRFLDETDLNIELRNVRGLQQGVSDKKIDLYPVGQKGKRGTPSVVEISSGDYRSFIMALDARQLIKCYETLDRDALFSLNIRNFIGNTGTNSGIIRTAREDQDNFFLYNNGISCLASKVTPSEASLEVEGLQVINGAQTVKALVHADKQARLSKSEIWVHSIPNVLVRITEIPQKYGDGGRVRENITQYNNTQNVIRDSDFRSNDLVQKNLKLQFGDLYRKGKKVAYIPKRTDKILPNSEVIRLEEFAKSIYAFLYEPVSFSGSSSFLYNTEKSGGYLKVFGDESVLFEKMPEDEFRLRAGIYWVAQEFAQRLRKIRTLEEDSDSRAALERKWLVVYAASVVFKECCPGGDWKSQIRKLYKGDWSIDDGGKGEVVRKIFEAAKAGVMTAYKIDKKNDPKFVHRNWMRSKDTPGQIANILQDVILPAHRDNIISLLN